MDAIQLIAYAICMAPLRETKAWAIKWLSGEDRSPDSARLAVAAAEVRNWSACAAGLDNQHPRRAKLAAEMAADAADVASDIEHFRGLVEFDTGLWPDEQAVYLARAQAILAGEFPAERFAECYSDGRPFDLC